MQFKTLAFQTLFVSAFAAPAPVLNNPDVDALNEVDAAVASLPINTKRQILNNANVDALNEVDAAVASLPINTKRQILNNPDVDALNTVDATVVSLSGKDGEDSLLNLKRADAGSITDVLDNLLATISPLVGEVCENLSLLCARHKISRIMLTSLLLVRQWTSSPPSLVVSHAATTPT